MGTSTLKTVLVTNTGSAPLFITSATALAPFSTVTLGTCATQVNVGKTCKLNVTFAPTPPAGGKSATLSVFSSNAPSPQTTLLTGTTRQGTISATAVRASRCRPPAGAGSDHIVAAPHLAGV